MPIMKDDMRCLGGTHFYAHDILHRRARSNDAPGFESLNNRLERKQVEL